MQLKSTMGPSTTGSAAGVEEPARAMASTPAARRWTSVPGWARATAVPAAATAQAARMASTSEGNLVRRARSKMSSTGTISAVGATALSRPAMPGDQASMPMRWAVAMPGVAARRW